MLFALVSFQARHALELTWRIVTDFFPAPKFFAVANGKMVKRKVYCITIRRRIYFPVQALAPGFKIEQGEEEQIRFGPYAFWIRSTISCAAAAMELMNLIHHTGHSRCHQ